MVKVADPYTGNGLADAALTDMAHSLFRSAREMRGLMQVASNVVLWDIESKDSVVPATVAKKGHHPAVRILIEQGREYDRWKKLEDDAESSPAEDALAIRVQVAKGKQRALSDLRDTSLKIQQLSQEALRQANDLITKLASMRQQMVMHREKMGIDLDNAGDAELLVIAEDGPTSESADVPSGPRRLESFVEPA